MNRHLLRCFLIALCVGQVGAARAVTPLGTAFTYQGALQDAGSPANGQYDFRFRLYDDPAAGNQIGSDFPIENLPVTAGVFTAVIDFGVGAFGPNARWLEVAVRPGTGSGSDPYTPLTPRQPVTPSPNAIFSLNSGDNHWTQVGGAIVNNNPGFVGINRTSTVTTAEYFGIQAPVASGYGGMYIRTDGASGQPFYGYSNGVSSAWHYLDGATNKWILHNGGLDALVVTSAGDVGIGRMSPATRLDVNTTTGDAIRGTTNAAFSYGVHGTGLSAGVYGQCSSSDGAGVYGEDDTNGASGVEGVNSGSGGSGVAGYSNPGTGVYGQTSSGYGVYGSNGGSDQTGYAGYFNGRVHINGTLTKNGGSFMIDHPLDPLHKYLSHSFVESPDMMNVYNGNVTTDADGKATIDLPNYFQALNKDFRYQLTPIGQFAQAMIEKEISDNRFVIRTDKPNVRVSWQVTGIRHDPWADANRIVVEEEKPLAERGKYLNPSVYPTADNSTSVTTGLPSREKAAR